MVCMWGGGGGGQVVQCWLRIEMKRFAIFEVNIFIVKFDDLERCVGSIFCSGAKMR